MTFSDPYSVSLPLRCKYNPPHTSKVVSHILLNEIAAFDCLLQDLLGNVLKNNLLVSALLRLDHLFKKGVL
jgi:hypothetical protein